MIFLGSSNGVMNAKIFRQKNCFFQNSLLRDPTTLLGYIGKLPSSHCKVLRLFPNTINLIVGWLRNKNV